jgi:hypothetical protein
MYSDRTEVMDVMITFWKVCACYFPCVNDLEGRATGDTVLHSWEVLAKILAGEDTMGIVCDIGMSVNTRRKRHHILTPNR